MDTAFLEQVLIIFALSIAALALCYRMKMPGIVAFFLTGIIAGPYGLGLITNRADVEILAELGIIFLLFTIGMELSLKSLLDMKKGMLTGGVLQIGLTIGVVAVIASAFGLAPPEAIFFGMLLAHTSTTVMLTVFQHRGEVDTPPVRLALGISVLQDLSTVPMILLVPMLGGMGSAGVVPSLINFVLGLVLLGAVTASALWVVPRLLYRVASLRSRELFMITVISLCLGTAWLTSRAGLSLALGAFLAGLIISESEYSNAALSTVIPFRDIFTSFFFVSMGMLLNTGFFAAHALLIVAIIIGVIVLKAIIGAVAVLPAGVSLRTAVLTGLAIGQIGEFAFILSRTGIEYGLLGPDLEQIFLAVSVGTMAVAPFVIASAPQATAVVRRLPLPAWLRARDAPLKVAPANGPKEGHIIIIGFGPMGRHVAEAARSTGVPYMAVDLNPKTVREGRKIGEPIFFGDAINEGVLAHAGVERARVVVVTIPNAATARQVTAIARKMNPDCAIITRTRYMEDSLALYAIGANDVVCEEFETAAKVLARVLVRYPVQKSDIDGLVASMRTGNYEMLRQASGQVPSLQDIGLHLDDAEISIVRVEEGAPVAGKTLAETDLRRRYAVTVLAIRRGAETLAGPDGGTSIEAGDLCILIEAGPGNPEVSSLFRPAAEG
ncbi:cation:proton antiporter [Methanoculleus sp. 10]|uniref:cation:proton antiporter domain-containing protein n=1 Tax=Methanoculleus sp. 10 TaxID=430615 RepID=UPI0025FE35CB|nr:cation:proton antiporter [Methanoculleus sp. 10]